MLVASLPKQKGCPLYWHVPRATIPVQVYGILTRPVARPPLPNFERRSKARCERRACVPTPPGLKRRRSI
eukprot:3396763-Pyramimonas_sp.AAC.1